MNVRMVYALIEINDSQELHITYMHDIWTKVNREFPALRILTDSRLERLTAAALRYAESCLLVICWHFHVRYWICNCGLLRKSPRLFRYSWKIRFCTVLVPNSLN